MAVSVEQRQRVAASTAPSRPMRYYLGATARYTLLTILALIAFAPFILSFLGTFKTNAELVAFPPSILPKEWLLDNWLRVWNFTLPTVQGRVLPRWLGRVDIPTLVVWGEDDRLLPSEIGRASCRERVLTDV